MAVCKCGEKLKQLYSQDGGGALECPGCGRYEERRVSSIKPIYDVIKRLNELSDIK
jgi:exosome complex RNA-binding protein Csl4